MTSDLRGLTISEFGRRAGLSVKALRLYEASGLLPPAEIDPQTGYRRYALSQLDRARRISLLRRNDMPLSIVAEVLVGTPTEAADRLDRWWAAQEQAIAARRSSVGWLRAQLLATDQLATDPLLATDQVEPGYPVRLREVTAVKLASVRYETDQAGLMETIERGEAEVRAVLDAAGAATTTEHWVIYHSFVTPETAAPVEICVPFRGTAEPADDVVIRIEPAHTQAYATVARDDCFYPRIMRAYAAVESFVVEASAPPREIYLGAWHEIAGTDPFVHVAQPIEVP
ncbi:MerR family transcriptional regulator [Winogradskya consettensis]|uniref:MerR family transcriptional regulator n=1 Tax=Winogradskya consettensis TaxID=113560 RepID=A0A919T0G6_9ACTN|nr:MerR family transcriptional regulator [Actinoplanes consettensis]GIM80702.1 MerR family transcriptional regulator [Actinoplanes consettensis]